jgi:aspartyl-tRNA(Asn)/glutamyl-tRNA(Gln) amidotransferase subunit B
VRAIDFEAARQVELIEGGGTVRQETRHWDENLGATSTLRVKEEADDYRYFREPDLVDLVPDAGVAGPGTRRPRADARRTARRPAQRLHEPAPALLDALEVVIDLGLDAFVIAALDAGVDADLAIARAANELPRPRRRRPT